MNALKIYSDSPLSDDAVKLLREGVAPHEIVLPRSTTVSVLVKSDPDPAFGTVDIAFGQPDVKGVLKSGRLRWVHITSAGYTRYDTAEFRAAAAARGLVVTNSSTVYAGPCADHALAFMLAQSRSLPTALRSRCANGTAEWNRLRDSCVSLRHQRVLLLGYGAIAIRLLELLRPFEMEIVALRRQPAGNENIPVITIERLPQALAAADHVMNLLPENAASARFVTAERLAHMKPGAVFYNIGRGSGGVAGGAAVGAPGRRLAGCDRSRTVAAGSSAAVHSQLFHHPPHGRRSSQ
jgi:phosphoglycerate dehydrogenase-like enzyme